MNSFYGYSMQNALEAQKQYLQQQMSNIDMQLAGIQQAHQPQQIPTSNLMVRIVNSMEEVNNLPCPADGSSAYYPCPMLNKIFIKHIGNDGKIAIDSYVPETAETNKDSNTSLSTKIEDIENRLTSLEAMLKEETQNESHGNDDAK